MVVLIILVLSAAVALPAFRSAESDGDSLDLATRRVGVLLTFARDSAIRAGVPVTVLIDSVDARIWLDAREAHGAVAWELPEGESTLASPRLSGAVTTAGSARASGRPADAVLALPGDVRMELSTARGRFTFAPSGAFDGDSIVLRRGAEVRVISPNPWNGDVQVR
ncbi:MAG TPA: GspH/FimT family pseudopilin [Longimicrobiales bacterium]|nr:GspH/FimT family pseudopilin [Longimicrobiales bacterium]